jgi:hypothetical protein
MKRVVMLVAPIAALAGLQCACEAVPVLTFTPADATADAVLDGEALAADGGLDGCAAPGNGQKYSCCGAVACEGCTTDQCGTCMSSCAPPGFCCAKNKNVMCVSAGMMPCQVP